jgi:hypothetical protein
MENRQDNLPQPTIVAKKASILEVDGLQFKDLNGNGKLDPYEDWRSTMCKHFPGSGLQRDGLDPHNEYGKEQVYPGNNFAYHLIPFKAALEAKTAQMMPYYGIPVDVTGENVGIRFVRGPLRRSGTGSGDRGQSRIPGCRGCSAAQIDRAAQESGDGGRKSSAFEPRDENLCRGCRSLYRCRVRHSCRQTGGGGRGDSARADAVRNGSGFLWAHSPGQPCLSRGSAAAPAGRDAGKTDSV